jgi:lysophospholipase L1-like esterase
MFALPRRLWLVLVLTLLPGLVVAQPQPRRPGPPPGEKWVAVWAASAHGPYPVGNATAQPELKFAFPSPDTGANDQTFRLIVRPDLWGQRFRLRFSNAFGTQPVTFDGVHLGVQATAGAVVRGTNRPVTFAGKKEITVEPGKTAYSDPVGLDFVRTAPDAALSGRKLAASFHVVGKSGKMTWHAKALQTSYVGPPGGGAHGHEESDGALPFSTTAWYFLDAVELLAPADTVVVAAFGDSITDGTASTLNGDDRYPDVLSRRLHAVYRGRIAVVNAGIGGNQVVGPAKYTPAEPYAGGPASSERLERDVLSLAGVTHVIWMEGINDLARNSGGAAPVIAGLKDGVARLRAKKIKVIGGTLTTAFGSASAIHGSPEVDKERREINDFIRAAGSFDGVVDFDAATLDTASGGLKPEYQPNSTVGGPGDKLHPNRAGYTAMANAVDPALFAPARRDRK